MFDFKYHLKNIPDQPGVYIMKNSLGEVIYVGKAKILKNRVRQYFQSLNNKPEKVKAMVSHISEFEYIVTDSEMEALILECNLIKKYKPRYNILLKDDKHYPFIKITINEEFPRVFITRTFVKDGNKYFGPYTDAAAVYETLELIKIIFPVRTCKKSISENNISNRPCLNYHMKKCNGPCAGLQSKEEYKNTINEIINLLNGKNVNIVNSLKLKMEEASKDLKFEKAASYRDKIMAIEKILEKQKIFLSNGNDEDFINIANDDRDTCVQIFFGRDGKIIGKEDFILENTKNDSLEYIIGEFIKSFYGGTAKIPKNIYVPCISEIELIEEWLTLKKGTKVNIRIPKKGEKKSLLDMVEKNAQNTLEKFKFKILKDKEIGTVALNGLKEMLDLEATPHRIEAFDISNIQGFDSVGSMVVFEDGKPKNSDYRRFKIKTVKGSNDYDSMREILTRRFQRGLNEVKDIQQKNLKLSSGKFCVFPDLILMDGGKGQVNIAINVLEELNINIPVAGMVKDDKHKTRGIIYNNREVDFSKKTHVIKLITRIQDEVHRFAIAYHRTLRDKRTFKSILEEIPNIGVKRQRQLITQFVSVENIKKASFEELINTPSIDRKAAENIINFFRGDEK